MLKSEKGRQKVKGCVKLERAGMCTHSADTVSSRKSQAPCTKMLV
jgi:hypothetical protein